jgi:hypothetical protein
MINDTALMGSYQSPGLLKPIDPASVAGGDRIKGTNMCVIAWERLRPAIEQNAIRVQLRLPRG